MLVKYDRLHTSLRQQASSPSVQWDHPFPRGLYLSSCRQDGTSWLFIVDLLKLSAVTRSNPHPIIFLESCSQVAVEIFGHISLENYSSWCERKRAKDKERFWAVPRFGATKTPRFRHKHILVIQSAVPFLGDGNSNIFLFLKHPETWGRWIQIWLKNFPSGWVETTNYSYSFLFQKNSRLLDGVSIKIPKGLAC